MDIANKVMQIGLEYKSPSIKATAICQTGFEELPEYNQFSTLLNWPHHNFKGLVLIAIPNECLSTQGKAKPIWKYKPTTDEKVKATCQREYAIKPEYIVGVIDVLSKQITENPTYTNEHSYDGLVLDDSVLSINMPKDKDATEIVEDSIENESVLYGVRSYAPSNKSTKAEVEDNVEEIYGFYNWILRTKGRIVEANGHKLLDFQYADGTNKEKEISEYISRLMQIVPSLRTIGIDDKEIDDFIGDVRMSGISKITDEIKRYQKEIDWEEAKTSGDWEADDWEK